MPALLDGARRAAHWAAQRARRRLSGNDGGFVLLESIIAISLITFIMAAVGAEYVGSVASVARQRTAQGASQVANSALEQVRALRPSDLVAGRGSAAVATQFQAGNAIPTITPWLQNMDQASDPNVAAAAGANATIPTCAPAPQGPTGPAQCTQKPGVDAYTVSQFIGTCWLVSAGTSSNCVPAAQKTASSISYLRVVVAVSWRNGACSAGCYYVTGTLVNAAADPTFKANQPPIAAPVIMAPGDQNNDIGDAVNVQLSQVVGTGVPGFTWTVASGSLPAGLSLSSSGVISGVVTGPIGSQSISVLLTDGYGRTDTTTFAWTVFNPPTVTAPPAQTIPINTAFSLQVATSCTNTPCRYTLNNAPSGLTISNTGLITGTPTTAGTTTTSITTQDASGRTVTSSPFTVSVLPIASTCPTAVTLPNGSFETPTVGPGAGSNLGNGTSGMAWRTNDSNNQVEYWANGGSSTSNNGNTPLTAKDGTQWVELNGAGMDTLYQDLPTTPGQVLQWSLWHRARNTTGNVNAKDSMQVQLGSTTQQTAQVPSNATSPTISDGAAAWVQYTGVYTVPSGQSTTRFQVTATATSSGSVSAGNFLDAVSVTGAPCLLSAVPSQANTVNSAISPLQLAASQGSTNYTWSGGATLPAGLTLSASGQISGTPTSVGTSNVQLILTDQLTGYQQFVTFTWSVYAGPFVTAPGNQTTSVGATVSVPVNSNCPNTPCTYTLNNPPAGLSINSITGTITGTPTAAGNTTSTITISDGSGASVTSASFTWTVKAAPTVVSPGNQTSTIGASLTLTPASSCANTTCTYRATNLPSGLGINSSTGAITGTPSATGTSNVTVTVLDAAGSSASTSFTWTVVSAPTVTTPSNQTTSVGATVNVTVGSTCANTPCTYTLNNPPGGLRTSGATIVGTPTTAGTVTSTITVTDASGVTATTATFTWTVKAAPTITTPANQTTSVGASVNLTVASSCANTSCTYTATGLPAGLTINPGTGTITGNPSATGTFTSTVTITDAAGSTATTSSFTWTVKAAPTITTPSNQKTTIGAAVNLAIASSCANSSCTYSATGLPAGLSINAGTGTITGNPSATGSFPVTVTVRDAAGSTVSTGSFTWTVYAAPTITTPSNQTTSVGATVNVTVGSTCANTPCTYTLNNPPGGLRTSGATIVGTPTTAGTVTSTITVTDASGVTATTATFTWTVKAAPTITTPANQTTSVGATVNLTVASTCANTSCTYTATGLPTNLTINPGTGTITGNPSATGTFTSTVTITDAAGSTATTSSFTWTVKAAPTITTPSNQSTSVGATVNLTVASSCANTSCTYTATGLPTNLTINPGTGTITGSPSATGTFTSTVTITDAAGSAATTANFTWTVYAAPTIYTPPAQTTSVGAPINASIPSSCGYGPCTFSVDVLPAGLTLNAANGTISGSPTTVGTTTTTMTIRDAAGSTASTGAFTTTVKAAPTITTPGNQTTSVGASVSLTPSSSCGYAACTYSAGTLPSGLTINASTGAITGTPTAAGTTATTVTITDAAGSTASASFSWTVKAAPTITAQNQNTTIGAAVNYTPPSTCANGSCTYSAGNLPAGLAISASTGAITGTPTTAGTSNPTVTVRDAAGSTASATFTWTVYARPTVTSPGNQTSTVNTALILPISSTCANTSCSYALSGAPAGLSINTGTGRITGTPTATGTSNSVKVTVTDAGGVAVDSSTFTWTITSAPSVTAPSAQSTVNNAAVSLTLTKSCPDGPCAYTLNGGPAGLSINSSGVITGTVTSAPQTFSGVTVTVTDSSGVTATSAAFTWTVTAPLAGRWTFDEGSGNSAADSSGANHPATLSGGYGRTSTDVQGANAVTLNGSSGTAAVTSSPVLNTTNSFTVSAWVKLASTSGYQTFVSQDGSNVSGFYLQLRSDTGRFGFTHSSSDSTSSSAAIASAASAPVVGQWYQLTGVYDSAAGTISLFVNGVRQGSPVAAPNGFNATGHFAIGRGYFSSQATDWTNGAIDDVRAYGSALSDSAAAQLAQAGYWRLDEGTGTTARDSSPNGATATLSGGTSWTTGASGGSAVQFNGSSGVITATNPLDTSQSFSVSAWAKADSTNSTGVVVSADGSTISSFLLRQQNDKWAFLGVAGDSANTTVTSATATSSLAVGQWYYLVGVYDSVANKISLYVNGVLQGSPVAVPGNFKASGALVIGRSYYQGNANYFGGAIDDVHAYRFSLDQAGVTSLTTQTPPTPGAPTAAAGNSSATVSWTAPTNIGGSPVTGYIVTPYLDGAAQTPVTYNSTATSQTISGLVTGQSYTFSVAAVNANGSSPTSAVSGAVLVT